jgi:DNA transformation protein
LPLPPEATRPDRRTPAIDPERIGELFSSFGAVTVRRMFGGAGIYGDGLMFALVDQGVIYLKADDLTLAAFEREQMNPFSYATKNGRRAIMSYWRVPDRLLDDPDELAQWARQALAAAARAALGRRRQTAKTPRRPGKGGRRKIKN